MKFVLIFSMMLCAVCCKQKVEPKYIKDRFSIWLIDPGTFTTDQVNGLARILEHDTTLMYASIDSVVARAESDTLHFSIKKP